MLISQAFPSEFLKAADLQDRTVTVIMDHVKLMEVGDDTKPVLFFQGKEKGLVLNKTNSNNIAAVYGDDTDNWHGKEVTLYPTMVDYQGRSVPAIRVKVPQPKERARPAANGNGTVRLAAVASQPRVDINDEIPF